MKEKRLVWTFALSAVGLFVGLKSPENLSAITIPGGAFFGGLIGFGFGSIFTRKDTRSAIIYWGATAAVIGVLVGLLSRPSRIPATSLCGFAIGCAVGGIIHFVSKWCSRVRRFKSLLAMLAWGLTFGILGCITGLRVPFQVATFIWHFLWGFVIGCGFGAVFQFVYKRQRFGKSARVTSQTDAHP